MCAKKRRFAGRMRAARCGAFLLLAASVCGYGAVAARCGASPLQGLLAAACGALCVVLPGVLTARFLCGTGWRTAPTALSLVCGLAQFALAAVLASATGAHWLAGAVPLALAGALLWRERRAVRALVRRWRGIPAVGADAAALAAVCAFLLALCALCSARYAHPAALGAVAPDQDFYYNVGNVHSFLLGFPPRQLRYAGMTLRYHFLTELLAAGLSMATGIPAYDALGFWLTPMLLCGVLAALWECGQLLFGGGRAQTWLLLLFTLGSGSAGLYKVLAQGLCPFWNLSLRHLFTNINGMTLVTLLLAAFAALFAALCRAGFRGCRGVCCAAALCFFLLCFAKAPVAGVAALAALCAGAALALRRAEGSGRALAFAALLLAVFAALYGLYYSVNAAGSVTLSFTGTLYKSYFRNILALIRAKSRALWLLAVPCCMLAQSVCMAPGAAVLALSGLWRDVRGLFARAGACPPGWRLLAWAMAAGGLLAFFLFDHEAMSQMYFAFAGLFFLNLLAADRASALLSLARSRGLWPRLAALAAAGLMAAGVCTAACTDVYLARTGLQPLLYGAQAATQQPSKTPVTAGEEEAMAWLAAHSGPQEVFATNRVHSGKAEEGFSFIYTGLSGRACYLETFKYAASNTGAPAQEVWRRVDVVYELFSGPSADRAQALCAAEGIGWLAYSRVAYGAWAPPDGLTPAFDNGDVAIYRM